MNRVINYVIDSASDGLRVEQFLKRRGYSSQNLAEIKRMPESILVNGVHYYMRQQLVSGDSLSVRICETGCSRKIPPIQLPLDIVYEDEDLIVINKPSGMPIHPSLNHYTNSMANALAWYYQEQGKPFIFRCCNRLDRDTSGLTVVAKHLVSASILSNMVRRHQLHSEYLAIVRGQVTPQCGTIDAPLSRKPGTIIDVEQMRSYTDEQLVVVCTGSQGEPMSALSRMSTGDHRQVRVGPSDYIILSATPIPGNEKLVGNVVNDLMKLGADVIYERMYDVHVSGHACQDETKMILSLTRPKYFVPVHGEYKHLMKNAGVARSMGMERKNIIISDIGRVIETDGVNMRLNGTVPSGRVLVDGLGVGDVGSVVLRDRKLLAEEGLIVVAAAIDGVSGEVVAGPDLVSRGFVYVRENEEMMEGARRTVLTSLSQCKLTGYRDWSAIKNRIRDDLADYIYARTRRRPMILPVLEEVNG